MQLQKGLFENFGLGAASKQKQKQKVQFVILIDFPQL
jgi:hypothetical protein